ncbi:small guanosine triphosphatase family Ras-related in brain (Rab) family protein (macronuclear) [Tetrahymena thermophila SB210]|uniref:Small guanosine triphosphatase family Ras-related in brain (Rab) family protein n=2 Tax=Tetrahymena thermophila TaxID=5911 RepID=I7MCK4_TETTS|nr:small guanosine triphosphatase family Ras-related in brain (Rab) family protein [Tetrahymena thermophila SB210]EAR84116.1 small guanosine triphosphatase family Ras-related in brain (Rab) family protein [Tetrahymena thermophila SB210]BAJ21311.1 Rab-family small GTPase RabX14 [Tetrahymena thermophila]|eukprot:XP_001031779.1 small guanosine triphosphatase family Ras-related in brain (Rab) family protein [Tetrahymena thermophila SB210]
MNNHQSSSSNTKIIIVGAGGIGKSTFIQYYVNGKYLVPNSTVLCDFFVKQVKYKSEQIRLEIWDTAGQPQFQNLISQFYRNTSAAILAFDINNIESLRKLDFYFNDLNNQLGQDVIKVIISTRCDLKGMKYDEKNNPIKAVSDEEINQYVKEKGLKYFETSSKADIGVKDTFNYIIEEILKKQSIVGTDNTPNNNISLIEQNQSQKPQQKKEGCCSS